MPSTLRTLRGGLLAAASGRGAAGSAAMGGRAAGAAPTGAAGGRGGAAVCAAAVCTEYCPAHTATSAHENNVRRKLPFFIELSPISSRRLRALGPHLTPGDHNPDMGARLASRFNRN